MSIDYGDCLTADNIGAVLIVGSPAKHAIRDLLNGAIDSPFAILRKSCATTYVRNDNQQRG